MMHIPKSRKIRTGAAGALIAIAAAASAAAFQALPPGAQVNDDPVAGIDKTKASTGESRPMPTSSVVR